MVGSWPEDYSFFLDGRRYEREFSEILFKLKVSITCGRKFHSDHLAAAFDKLELLEQVVTANPPSHYRRHKFERNRVKFTFPYYVPAHIIGKLGLTPSIAKKLGWWATNKFDRVASRLIGDPDVVISWAWSALNTFKVAKKQGIYCVLEECGTANAYQELLLKDEFQRWDVPYVSPLAKEIVEKEKLECEEADLILCPSDYVADSFRVYGVPREKCLVVPYASNPKFQATHPKTRSGKLRILFVGTVGFRKGVIYLLKALDELPRDSYECTVIGRVEPSFAPIFRRYQRKVLHIESVEHSQIRHYFQEASVFVLPTLDEGMAYVIMEALASGTPVITTHNSGAVGKVLDGINGWVVPIRDVTAIANSLMRVMDQSTDYTSFSVNALEVCKSWTWDDYAQVLCNELIGRLSGRVGFVD